MVITENEARSRQCCAAKEQKQCGEVPLLCQGLKCMAWRFVSLPVLTRTVILGSGDVSKITGEKEPSPELSADYSKEFDDFMRRALAHDKVNARLIPEHNNSGGWELLKAPGYDDEEGLLYSNQVRERDPEATGYCGMAGKPDELNGAK